MHIFKKNLFIVFIYCFVFFGCSKKQTPINTQPNTEFTIGTLDNKTGFDGCGWTIEVKNPVTNKVEVLEPTNLNAFNLTLVSGKTVKFTYKTIDKFSVCMLGPIVELEFISYY
ncbi:MAG: hypothetical protein LCH32_12575 [Bacteroidetes bacterium]|nr:hypothetical protein [Bacteroidota bacterium]